MKRFTQFFAAFFLLWPSFSNAADEFDLIVYGGSPAGLISAVAALRDNGDLKVAIIEPTNWIGGLVTGGLSRTDKGQEQTIGGMTREYFEMAKKIGGEKTPMWYAEPKQNMAAFRELLNPYKDQITLVTGHRIKSVVKDNNRIRSLSLDDQSIWKGRIFIDASYEGDLMALSGVSYRVGRESREEYGEPLAGYTPMPLRPHGPDTMENVCSCHGGTAPHFIHGTPVEISAYDQNGELISGVVKADPQMKPGDADELTQAYNFRICVTQRDDIRVPFPKPIHYDPNRYEMLLRLIERFPSIPFGRLVHLGAIANGKFDLNAQGLFSTDYAGGNAGYPDGDHKTRDAIWQDHVDYVQGYLWFLGNDERVPRTLRDEVNSWGLCKDEFVDNGNWPYALYVREARRMKGEYVMRQEDTWTEIVKPDSVGMGSFILDCHIVQRIVTPEGLVTDEGSFQDSPTRPYQIPYRSLLPQEKECENLLVPVCLSASHIAYCSIRMEPVYMTLGQASGTAAAMALAESPDEPVVHRVDVAVLQKKLKDQNVVLEIEGLADLITVDKLLGIALDDRSATFVGSWGHSGYGNPVEGTAAHDSNSGKGNKSATFTVSVPETGDYEVRFAYAFASNRASAAPIDITHANGKATVEVDQRKKPEHEGVFTTLGVWNFAEDQPVKITIRNDDTDSYVSIDAIQLLPVKAEE
ncbi:MAG: FAD-dependent oxidoreductase [Verrucomicrobiales bacterium]|nr:FAD-dependent oxidoreductase [Verrucomicrobiales bacterium]